MTERESHFLCLLKGCKWKGWITDVHYYSTPDAFFTFKAWMEEHMPKEWDWYLEYAWRSFTQPEQRLFTKIFDKQLNLSNLVAYLIEHREEWGVIGNDENGFIFHPALEWWDKEE